MNFGLKFAIFASEIHTHSKPGGSEAASLPSGQHVLPIIFVIEEEISDFQGRGKTYIKTIQQTLILWLLP